jgi:G:T/U-mismatch repair DNA glycosylase
MTRYAILPYPKTDLPYHDQYLLTARFGATDIVKRPTISATEIMEDEFEYGKKILYDKIRLYEPKILLFVFKKAAEKLLGKSLRNRWGFINEFVLDSQVFILPFPYRKRELVEIHLNELD